jgi:hypothetical protein
VVLDSAGRLQIPKEYLEEFGIRGRVRLELTEEGILIRPAPHAAHTAETILSEMMSASGARRAGALGRLFTRLRQQAGNVLHPGRD